MSAIEKGLKERTATLSVDVTYDPEVTDAESITSAADQLWETALSTPGILDEYGNPTFGSFDVLMRSRGNTSSVGESDRSAVNTSFIINVHGGIVQDVFCSDPNAEVVLVDWDNDGHEPSDPGYVEVAVENGRRELVYVADYPVNPMSDLAGTDVERAIEAAEVAHGAA